MWGGPRLANFVAMNIGGPEIHSIFRWRKQNTLDVKGGLRHENFANIKQIFLRAKSKHQIPLVPVLLAEDET